MKCDRQIIELKEKRQIRNKTEIQPFNTRRKIEFQNHLREGGRHTPREKNAKQTKTKAKAEKPPFCYPTVLFSLSLFVFWIKVVCKYFFYLFDFCLSSLIAHLMSNCVFWMIYVHFLDLKV
jgi:hypothetical protein